MTIVEFLTARLDERAEVARAAFDETGNWSAVRYESRLEWWEQGEYGGIASTGYVGNRDSGRIARHMAYNDPAYVLADIAATRALMAGIGEADAASTAVDNTELGYGLRDEWLRLLASPFADHPDFDSAWAV